MWLATTPRDIARTATDVLSVSVAEASRHHVSALDGRHACCCGDCVFTSPLARSSHPASIVSIVSEPVLSVSRKTPAPPIVSCSTCVLSSIITAAYHTLGFSSLKVSHKWAGASSSGLHLQPSPHRVSSYNSPLYAITHPPLTVASLQIVIPALVFNLFQLYSVSSIFLHFISSKREVRPGWQWGITVSDRD